MHAQTIRASIRTIMIKKELFLPSDLIFFPEKTPNPQPMLIFVNTKKVIETLKSMERIDKKMIWEYGIENKLKFKQQQFDMWVSKVKSFFCNV